MTTIRHGNTSHTIRSCVLENGEYKLASWVAAKSSTSFSSTDHSESCAAESAQDIVLGVILESTSLQFPLRKNHGFRYQAHVTVCADAGTGDRLGVSRHHGQQLRVPFEGSCLIEAYGTASSTMSMMSLSGNQIMKLIFITFLAILLPCVGIVRVWSHRGWILDNIVAREVQLSAN